MRAGLLEQAIRAGKHIDSEKPISNNAEQALAIVRLAREKGVKTGVVQDKLFLPGLRKIAMLRDAGFFGRILSVRGEFGYWVFEGDWQPAQRPSLNYRKADGGGIIIDRLCHWRYVLDNLLAPFNPSAVWVPPISPNAWTSRATAMTAIHTTPPMRPSNLRAG